MQCIRCDKVNKGKSLVSTPCYYASSFFQQKENTCKLITPFLYEKKTIL